MPPIPKRKRSEQFGVDSWPFRQTTLQFKPSPRNSNVIPLPDDTSSSPESHTESSSHTPQPQPHQHQQQHYQDPPSLPHQPSPSPSNSPLPSPPSPLPSKAPPPPPPPPHHHPPEFPCHSVRNINLVTLPPHTFPTWYPSPYPTAPLGLPAPRADLRPAPSTRKAKPPAIDRLIVCPLCFKYTREVLAGAQHVEGCWKGGRGRVPGRVVWRGGSYGLWEVDGEGEDGMFCQNLSLFGKLFLETKSVFFDVEGFKFFILVYTPTAADNNTTHPHSKLASTSSTSSSSSPSFPSLTIPSSTPQILGFFSKEKMSWDPNNLACLLIFPPYLHLGLGHLLISLSYEISKRERLLGGPEKPLSDLGLKGYRRYWGAEIARYLLGVDEEEMVTVRGVSRATWIAEGDVEWMVGEMGVVGKTGEGGRLEMKRKMVRDWVQRNRISLERACDPAGFVEGYAIKPELETEDSGEGRSPAENAKDSE